MTAAIEQLRDRLARIGKELEDALEDLAAMQRECEAFRARTPADEVVRSWVEGQKRALTTTPPDLGPRSDL